MKWNPSNLGLPLAVVFLLSGCGGGGGSSGSDSFVESDSGSQSVQTGRLRVPSVYVTTDNDEIYLSWSDSNAASYRVLYWEGSETPQEFITSGTEYMLPPLNPGDYSVLVEAYDDLGNSLFSTPVTVEVL